MLSSLTLDDIGGGLNVIDVGARDSLHPKWKPVERLINLIGFEPDTDECARLLRQTHNFNSARYLPLALSGERGHRILYNTQSSYCSSLLEPNQTWLKRFSFADLFEIKGTKEIETMTLADVDILKDMDVDVMKVDAQGLDLEIIANAGVTLERCFYIDIEPGFTQNYIGEYTYSQVDSFLRSQGFMLFDMKLHRVSRRNSLASTAPDKEQILWCESVWLKDYVSLASATGDLRLTRAKALKVLLLCALENCLDYGYELAELFCRSGLITKAELTDFRQREGWIIARHKEPQNRHSLSGSIATVIGLGLRLLPGTMRKLIAAEAVKPHLIRSLTGKP